MMPTSAANRPTQRYLGRDRRGGFTLMEVVLALTIVGMLATLAVPYFRPGIGAGALRARASEIAGLLRRDRNLALHLQRRSAVLVDAGGGAIRSGLLDETIVMPNGISLKLIPESGPGVVFLPDGSSSGARIVLAARQSSIAVDVNRLTAAIRISEAKP